LSLILFVTLFAFRNVGNARKAYWVISLLSELTGMKHLMEMYMHILAIDN